MTQSRPSWIWRFLFFAKFGKLLLWTLFWPILSYLLLGLWWQNDRPFIRVLHDPEAVNFSPSQFAFCCSDWTIFYSILKFTDCFLGPLCYATEPTNWVLEFYFGLLGFPALKFAFGFSSHLLFLCCDFLFASSVHCSQHFHDAALKPLSDNSSICVVSGLASVDGLLSFKLNISWFLV